MRYVLDSSGMLAVLFEEERGIPLRPLIGDAVIGAVNLAEVATVLSRRGFGVDEARAAMAPLDVPVLQTSSALAIAAGIAWADTRATGLSLGDRFALILARQLGSTLVTSDRRLAETCPLLSVQAWLLVNPGPGTAR